LSHMAMSLNEVATALLQTATLCQAGHAYMCLRACPHADTEQLTIAAY
jgi:hypothetical protein